MTDGKREQGLNYFLRKRASNEQMGRILLPFYDSYGVYSSLLIFGCFLSIVLQPLLQLDLLKQARSPLRPPTGESPCLARVERAVNYQEGILIKFFMVVVPVTTRGADVTPVDLMCTLQLRFYLPFARRIPDYK